MIVWLEDYGISVDFLQDLCRFRYIRCVLLLVCNYFVHLYNSTCVYVCVCVCECFKSFFDLDSTYFYEYSNLRGKTII